MHRSRSLATMLLVAALASFLTGCRGGPSVSEAKDQLEGGEPLRALATARAAAARAALPAERVQARRLAFGIALSAGWSDEAAHDYLALRELLGGDERALVRELATGTLRAAQGALDPARRLRAALALEVGLEHERAHGMLVSALADAEPEVRAAALQSVGQLPNPAVALELIRTRVGGDRSGVVRAAGLRALRQLLPRLPEIDPARSAGDEVLALAAGGVRDPDEGARLAALDLLAAIGEDGRLSAGPSALRQRAIDALAGAVGHGSDAVTIGAAEALVALDPRRAWEAWSAAALEGALDAFGRALVEQVTPQQLSTQAPDVPGLPATLLVSDLEALRALLRATEHDKRLAAVRGLVGPAAARWTEELVRLARHDPAAGVRSAALRGLAASDTPQARAALADALEHPDAGTRRRALMLLEAIAPLPPVELRARFDAQDPALATDLARLLALRGGEAGLESLLVGLDGLTTRLPSLAALAKRGEPRAHARFVAMLDDADPHVRRLAAQGLSRCGEADDVPALVAALTDQTHDADLSAAAALMALEPRLPAPKAAPLARRPAE